MKSQFIVRRFMAWSSLIFGFLISYGANAQVPAISWETRLGGPYTDGFNAIAQTQDGGYVAAGIYNGGSGNGNYNYWIQKIDGDGNAVWSKTYGGTGQDRANSISQTKDGGYIVGGTAGNVPGSHGFSDAWVLKLDSLGNILWEKSYGGSHWDRCNKILPLPDNSFLALGLTSSDDGDLTGVDTVGFWGESDIWLMKIDANGNILWQKTYGGLSQDEGWDIIPMPGGEFAIAGTEATATGMDEIFVSRIDALGNEIWKKVFGYSDYDQAYTLMATKDNDLIVAGKTLSPDFPGFNGGGSDAMIVKLNGATGNTLWQTAIGGSLSEGFTSITQYNNMYVLAGTSKSSDGDVINNFGYWDIWLVAIDNEGSILWNKNFGGNLDDGGSMHNVSVITTADNGLAVASMTGSDEIVGGGGLWDGYIFKLKDNSLGINEVKLGSISVYPNPVSNYLDIRANVTGTYQYILTDIMGRILKSGSFNVSEQKISLSGLPAGTYFLQLQNEKRQTFVRKIIKH